MMEAGSNEQTIRPIPHQVASSRTWLDLQFALLSAAGGLVLATGQDADSIAVIAIFTATVGFVFVDWLRVFELPAAGAYIGMAASAAYCVNEFLGLQRSGEPQMSSVALLLVLVQGVLMLQRKSRRILEQLTVFCLLELVVAAIFSDALSFGMLMVPISFVAAGALSLLGLVASMEEIEVVLENAPHPKADSRLHASVKRFFHLFFGEPVRPSDSGTLVQTASPQSMSELSRVSRRWARFATFTLAPAVLLIAAAFFYVLPRKVDASRSGGRIGPALVGFDDEVRLEQLGRVMQNSKPALTIKLEDAATNQPYRLTGDVYLRGKTLERYEVDHSSKRPVAKWVAVARERRQFGLLPEKERFASSLPETFDSVRALVTCEAMSRSALFAVAPYFRLEPSTRYDDEEVSHISGSWTLTRQDNQPPFPRIKYRFGTYAFAAGEQTRWIPATRTWRDLTRGRSLSLRALWEVSRPDRRRPGANLLRLNRSAQPTATRLATELIDQIPVSQRTSYRIASEFERFLATDPRFSYTLDLTSQTLPGVDPIEQFLSVDRKGHCQYFASALAIMLRAAGIPCRVVVGYRTEEFNQYTNHYVARQLHAHAWVEALINAEDIPQSVNLIARNQTADYWLRLDPTPSESLSGRNATPPVEGFLGLANNVWEDYVVELDRERQSGELVDAAGLENVRSSYKDMFRDLENLINDLRAGRLSGGSLRGEAFVWVLPLLGIAVLALLVAAVSKLRLPKRMRHPRTQKISQQEERPSVEFYAAALEQLQRIGIERRRAETPTEFQRRVQTFQNPLAILTSAFEKTRYGSQNLGSDETIEQALAELTAGVEATVQRSPGGTPNAPDRR
jgi:transglutaminase-like putative cysteine protease